MSKASEWSASRAATAARCPQGLQLGNFGASVMEDGVLLMKWTGVTCHREVFDSEDALALGRWLVETFGEEKS